MADLVVIIGPPASGKAAVGSSLAQITGFRLFHNHMTAEPAAALFGWGTPLFGEALTEIRLSLLSKALAHPQMPAIIFTFVWAFDVPTDNHFMAQLVELFRSSHCKVFFVELVATLQARVDREGTPLRLSLKPAKRDVERARALHAEYDGKYQMNSNNDFPYPDSHLIVDTERHTPAEAARLVAQHFGFAYAGS
jgi:cytidylate kinase